MRPHPTRELLVAVQQLRPEKFSGSMFTRRFCSVGYCILYTTGLHWSTLSLPCGIVAKDLGAMQEHGANYGTGGFLHEAALRFPARAVVVLYFLRNPPTCIDRKSNGVW